MSSGPKHHTRLTCAQQTMRAFMHGNEVSPLKKPLAGPLISLAFLSIPVSWRCMHAVNR